jgi:putative alpha-1,2-mannosidase
LTLPGSPNKPLVISSIGAPSKVYVKGLTVNGEFQSLPIIRHEQIVHGGEIIFDMSEHPESWGSNEMEGVVERGKAHVQKVLDWTKLRTEL